MDEQIKDLLHNNRYVKHTSFNVDYIINRFTALSYYVYNVCSRKREGGKTVINLKIFYKVSYFVCGFGLYWLSNFSA